MKPLWPHQVRGIDDLRESYSEGHRAVLCIAPCGSGKTRFAAELCASSTRLGNRVLFVVHTGELLEQTVCAVEEYGIPFGVIQATRSINPFATLQIGTIQTLRRRELPYFDLAIFDEAHLHVTSTSLALADRVHAEYILGLTATPTLLSGKSLADVYTDMRIMAQPSELIAKGILMEPTVFAPSSPDVSAVPTLGKDYDVERLEMVTNTARLVGDVAESYAKRVPHHPPALLFAVNRRHSLACRDKLRSAGFTAEHLDGDTPHAQRIELIDRFKRGEINVLCNVEILTTGFNHPPLECVLCVRPTQSLSLFIQMCNRALRGVDGKRRPVIIDHSGNTTIRHGFPHADREWMDEFRPTKKRKSNTVRLPSLRTCLNCYAVFVPKGLACPACGIDVVIEEEDVEHGDGELREVKKAPTPEEKRKQFSKLCMIAVTGKLSRYWVMQAFKREFGHAPAVKEDVWPKELPRIASIEREKIDRLCREKQLSSETRERMLRKAGLS